MKAEDLTSGTRFRHQNGDIFVVSHVVAVGNTGMCRVYAQEAKAKGLLRHWDVLRSQLFEVIDDKH